MIGFRSFRNGAWYEPTPPEKVAQIIKLLKIKKGMRAVDLGSGDGRLVIALANAGALATGYELDPRLVKLSRDNIKTSGVGKHAQIIQSSFWDADLASADLVCVYQVRTVMKRLEAKLRHELPEGARVVSNYWRFPTWDIAKSENDLHLYLNDA